MVEHTQEIISNELDDIIRQLSWTQFKTLIFDYNSLKESVSKGGVRIIKKNRGMLHPSIKKHCLENDKYLFGIFTLWFNEQKKYADCLSKFFESGEHKVLLEERDLNDSEYAINEKYFDRFINIIKLDDIDKFLLLSPVKFTSEQKEKLEHCRKQKQQDADKSGPQMTTVESTSQPTQTGTINLTKGEWKHHQKELKNYQKTIEKLNRQNTKLIERQKKHNAEKADLKKENVRVKAAYSKKLDKLTVETKEVIDRAEFEYFEKIAIIVSQKTEMQQEVKNMEKEIGENLSRLKTKNNRIRYLEKETDRLKKGNQKYFNQILAKIDIEDLISSLNAPDEVLELLDTFIRPAATDQDTTSIDVDLPFMSFWNNLSARENKIISEVMKINVKEVANRQYFKNWDSQKDDFIDLKCSLSTRNYLADMLFRILQQYFIKNENALQ